ncbi:MAG: SARP family transcriptional regulator, partial [Chloroflexi bacterium]|nr:SARP family transcriptional regulator [Chloroflexota bacterium]
MAELCISLLGPLQVTLGREAVAGFESNKPRALLAYLAIEAGRTHARETLAGLLWPDMPNDAALGNLRRVLSNLRQAIGDREAERPCLLITRDTVALDATASVVIDAARFAELVRGAGEASSACDRLEQAVALYRGDLLEGFSLADSAPFEEWLVVARERFRRQLLSALRRLAGRLEGLGDYGRARAYAWRLVELEPWDENAHRTLMRTLALSGRRAEALAHYAACCRLLERELGVAPSRETQALYERIREGSLTRPVSAAPGAP